MDKYTTINHLIAWATFLLQFWVTVSFSPLWDSVRTNVYQEYDVQEGNKVWVVRLDMGEKSTDLVVGEEIRPESRITLICTTQHGPAEWIYSGDAKPDFTTNTTIENLNSDGDILPLDDIRGAKRYVATLTLGKRRKLSTKDTGRYNCMTASPETGLQYKTLSAFYHLYVPGEKLFIRQGNQQVVYDLSKSAARIPCSVHHPKTSVSLQKMIKDNLEFVPNENMFYHPISGYYPKQNIPGTYICTAAYNNTFQMIHFTLVPASSTPDLLYHQNVPYNKRKPSKGSSKPESDLEWLIYSSPTKTQTPTKKTTSMRPVTTTIKPKRKSTSTSKPYIPFHIRYSSTTYAPFYTFYGTETSSTLRPTNPHDQKTSTSQKFNPSEYPIDLIRDEDSKRPGTKFTTKPSSKPTKLSDTNHENNDFEKYYSPLIPQELISYRPVFNFFKDTSKPNLQKPSKEPEVTLNDKETNEFIVKFTTTRLPGRTTPRRYRPTTMQTTQAPLTIPDTVICSQYVCGSNAECFVHNVYYDMLEEIRREAGCKCIGNYIGNPYLRCYEPTPYVNQDILYFNSSFRSPLIQLEINSSPEFGENSSETEGLATYSRSVGIIDM